MKMCSVLRLIKCHILKPICQSFDVIRYLFFNLTLLRIKEFHRHLLVSISTYPSFFHLYLVRICFNGQYFKWVMMWMLRCRLTWIWDFFSTFWPRISAYRKLSSKAVTSFPTKFILLLIVAIDNQARISRDYHFEACLSVTNFLATA